MSISFINTSTHSFDVMSCKPPYTSGATTGRRRSMANRLATEFFPKGRIHKLKQFFEDRTQPTSSLFKFYVDRLDSVMYKHFSSRLKFF